MSGRRSWRRDRALRLAMSGEPSYVELGVPDADRAVAFYGAVLRWAVDPSAGMTQIETSTLSIGVHGGDSAAHFEVLFAVPDLDAALAAVAAAGGEVVSPVTDSPDFGRWAECQDDQGVRFGPVIFHCPPCKQVVDLGWTECTACGNRLEPS